MKKNHLFFSSLIFSTIIFWLSNAFQVTKAQDTIQSKAKEFFSQYQNQETIEVTPKENQADVWRRYFAEHQGTLTSNTSNGLRVNTMPSHAHNDAYANAGIGVPISVWGNVQGGQLPYRFILEYGDGTVDSGDVANQKFIGGNHTYTTAGPKLTRLTVRDNTGASDTDSSLVRVFAAPTLQNNVNIAIEKGLLYLYQNQQTDGRWDYSTKQVATTGLAVLAFEANGHLPDNDNDKDIYAEFIRLGLTYLLDRVVQTSIGNQPYGNPDSDNDGKGAYFNSTSYDNGIAMQAVVSAHRNGEEANLDTIRSGVYNGQTMYDVMRDAIDQLAYSQGDNAPGRGGWRYDINVANNADNTSDHSTAQWCALALEAAEHRWGISAPQFVKDELLIWLQYIQDGTGGFGYHQQSYWNNTAKTGGGIASYVMLGYGSSATPVTNALSFLNSHWGDNFDGQNTAEHFNGNLYSMFSVAKGLRIVDNRRGVVNVGSHNWFQEYANHLLTHGTWGQKADGSWQDGGHLPGIHPLSTAFAILVLTPEIFEKPVAVIDPVSAKPPNWAFEVNGSHSYHTDPTKSIVEYLWDWNNDGTYDATGMTATNPGYAAQGTYTITLLVRDNSNPQLEDIETITVNICSGCAPPVAIAIPSERKPCYAGRVGEPMFFDGRESYEPEYPADSIVSYSWDLNGDGIFGDATTDTVTYTYNNVFNGEVGLQVTDANGLTSTQYVCISISVNDIYVESLTILPYCVAQGDSVLLIAVMRNNDTSITNYSNVLVRFYDGPPLTTGTQLGGDYFVDLNIAQSDTVTTTIQLPGVWLGTETLFVYIDPTNQIPEWDETNNVGWSEIVIGSCITLSGQKFYDVDGNGAKDVGEAGISGWLVNISGTRSAFGFTDANGNFEIRNLPPGTYTICEGERIGWIQTYPGPEGCYTATADPGDVISGNDFGNYPLGSISGRKFFDADADGVEDAGEQGIAGWNIVLSGTHPDTVLTDANGNYSFSGLPVGTYSLCEEVRPGWIQTFPLANSCYNFMLNGGENSTGNDFGNFQQAVVSGRKIHDRENDSAIAGNDFLNGWIIKLYKQGVLQSRTVTSGNGAYEFFISEPGIYTVEESLVVNWQQSFPRVTSSGVITTTYGNFAGPRAYQVTVQAGSVILNLDFGNFRTGNIIGTKFHDLNANGTLDVNEPGLFNWVIFIDGNNNGVFDFGEKGVHTQADGSYELPNLLPGQYLIREAQQRDWFQSTPDPAPINLWSAQTISNVQFGNYRYGSLSGIKYHDHNGNGSQNNDDEGLPNWTIFIDQNNNGTLERGELATVTDSSGIFTFSNLPPGDFTIREVEENGWKRTSANPTLIPLSSGENINGITFGNFELGELYGGKYHDIHGDSILTPVDSALGNWLIKLYKESTLLQQTVTSEQGMYSFKGLEEGYYTVEESLKSGWQQTFPKDFSPDVISLPRGAHAGPRAYRVHIVSGTKKANLDFGNYLSPNSVKESKIPDVYMLFQNYPNPFNPATTIRYAIPVQSIVHLAVYNVLGQEVALLVGEGKEPGYHSTELDASNLPGGIYFYKIVAGTYTDIKKLLVLH